MTDETSSGDSEKGVESSFKPPASGESSPLLDSAAFGEAQAFAGNSDQSKSKFKPPRAPAESPLLNSKIADEIQAFANNKSQDQQYQHNNDIHDLRMSHLKLLLGLALVWIFVILIVVLLQGYGQWFFPIIDGYFLLKFNLSDAVVIAFITSTTATVLGLYGIGAYWLYGKPEKDKKQTQEDNKSRQSPDA